MLVKYKAWKHLHGVTMEASSLSLSSVLISHPAQHKQIKRTSTPLSTPQVPPKHPLSTPQVELLIQKMSDSYMSMRDMADVCDIKDLKYFRESYITPALEEGLIERLYPNQPKHPKQQYRLTEAAKEWLKEKVK